MDDSSLDEAGKEKLDHFFGDSPAYAKWSVEADDSERSLPEDADIGLADELAPSLGGDAAIAPTGLLAFESWEFATDVIAETKGVVTSDGPIYQSNPIDAPFPGAVDAGFVNQSVFPEEQVTLNVGDSVSVADVMDLPWSGLVALRDETGASDSAYIGLDDGRMLRAGKTLVLSADQVRALDLKIFAGSDDQVDTILGATKEYGSWSAVDQYTVVTVGTGGGDMPHPYVEFPSDTSYDWVDQTEIQQYPHTAVGRVEVDHDPSDTWFSVGTGFMISPKHVVTNAHVILDENGEFQSQRGMDIEVAFGHNGLRGTETHRVGWEHVWWQHTFGEGEYPTWPDNDIAVIRLDQEVGYNTGWFGTWWSTGGHFIGQDVETAGYPSDGVDQDDPRTSGREFYQWENEGEIVNYLHDDGVLQLSSSMQGTGGASGSPVYYTTDDGPYVAGVFSGQYLYSGWTPDKPVAANFDPDSMAWIQDILISDGYSWLIPDDWVIPDDGTLPQMTDFMMAA